MSELGHAESEIRKLEDKILEIMVAADVRKEGLKGAEAALKADTAANEKEKEHARSQTAEDEKQLAELNAQRDQLRRGITDDTLRHYDRVLQRRGSAWRRFTTTRCAQCAASSCARRFTRTCRKARRS